MKPILGYFKCVILSPRKLVYDREIQSLFVTGDNGEYEILPYHYPVLGVIKKSDIIVNWEEKIPVNGGVIRFYANECIIMIEEKIEPKAFQFED